MDKLSILEVPEHPLDQLVNYFGVENIAEMTGRKKRLIRTAKGTLEYRPRQLAGVPSKLINLHEKNAFQNGDKRIAVMSEVASTGDSLHAGKSVGNQQRRLHIAAELKWSADKQIQDFGRTHRTGQVAPPVYLLVFTELGARKVLFNYRQKTWQTWEPLQRVTAVPKRPVTLINIILNLEKDVQR
ncbi:MAG: strawberry notch C-terminal domain-containing protein [Chloracidobacterium sp.]|nr:strawberry notch C-terminal domain-containing protein [Chloracidobacterium sp.]